MKNKFTLILILFMISGCASAGSVTKNYNAVNYADGVDKLESQAIAQHFLMNHPSGKYFMAAGFFTHDKGSHWEYHFSSKPTFNVLSKFNMTQFKTAVDKQSGKVLWYNIQSTQGGVPIEMESY